MKWLLLVALAGCAGRADRAPDWKLTRSEWNAIVVAPFTGMYDDYARAFDDRALAAQLGSIETRAHFAGDPANTVNVQRARWLLPTMYPARVVTGVDAVFVRMERGWGAITDIDAILVAKARALAPDCANILATVGIKRCEDMAYLVAEAAVLGDRAKMGHACSLAQSACVVKPSK